jgi:hypothetical protein
VSRTRSTRELTNSLPLGVAKSISSIVNIILIERVHQRRNSKFLIPGCWPGMKSPIFGI